MLSQLVVWENILMHTKHQISCHIKLRTSVKLQYNQSSELGIRQ